MAVGKTFDIMEKAAKIILNKHSLYFKEKVKEDLIKLRKFQVSFTCALVLLIKYYNEGRNIEDYAIPNLEGERIKYKRVKEYFIKKYNLTYEEYKEIMFSINDNEFYDENYNRYINDDNCGEKKFSLSIKFLQSFIITRLRCTLYSDIENRFLL